jgi:hypothetical protein
MRSILLAIAAVGLIAGSASAQNYPSGAAPKAAQTTPAPAARPAPSTASGPAAGATANTAAIATEAQAKSRIESSGFSNVSALTKDSAGIWHGMAMKDGMAVMIALDAQGNVRTE